MQLYSLMSGLLLTLGCYALLFLWGLPSALWLKPSNRLCLAPALGLATLATSLAAIAYFDVPLGQIVGLSWVLLAIMIAASAWLRRKQLRPSLSAGLPLLVALGIALIFTGWAYFLIGSDYFAFVNPDGWSYVCTADYLREHSISDVSLSIFNDVADSTGAWDGGRVDSHALWLHPHLIELHTTVHVRIGQFALLSFMSAVFGFNDTFYVLMPLLIAIIAAAGPTLFCLLRAFNRSTRVAWWGLLCWQLSPILAFTLYIQFLSQMIGLVLLPTIITLTRLALDRGLRPLFIPLTLCWGAIWSSYPELLPFIGFTTFLVVFVDSPGTLIARAKTTLRFGLPVIAGILLLHRGAITAAKFLVYQIISSSTKGRSGEGTFEFGGTVDALPFWLGHLHEPYLLNPSPVILTAATLLGITTLPLLVWGALQLDRLGRIALIALAVHMLGWIKFALLDDYGYGATKLVMFGSWILPIVAAGCLGAPACRRPIRLLALFSLFLVPLYTTINLGQATLNPAGRRMNPHFNGEERFSAIRSLVDEDIEREGIVIDIEHWNDQLWTVYWLRASRLSIWRAQSYLCKYFDHDPTQQNFHRREFNERWLITERSRPDIIERNLGEPIRVSGRFALYALDAYSALDWATVDPYPASTMGPPTNRSRGQIGRLVTERCRIRIVRPGTTARRLRASLAPASEPVQLELQVDGVTVDTFVLNREQNYTSAPLTLPPDGAHIVELRVKPGQEPVEGTGPTGFIASYLSILTDSERAKQTPSSLSLVNHGVTSSRDLNYVTGIDQDLWLHEHTQVTLLQPANCGHLFVRLTAPDRPQGEDSTSTVHVTLRDELSNAPICDWQPRTLEAGNNDWTLEIAPVNTDRIVRVELASSGGIQVPTDPRTLRSRLLMIRFQSTQNMPSSVDLTKTGPAAIGSLLAMSGIHTDLWLDEQAQLILLWPANSKHLRLRLAVPFMAEGELTRTLSVSLRNATFNEEPLTKGSKDLLNGDMEWDLELPQMDTDRIVRIQLHSQGGIHVATDPRELRSRLLKISFD